MKLPCDRNSSCLLFLCIHDDHDSYHMLRCKFCYQYIVFLRSKWLLLVFLQLVDNNVWRAFSKSKTLSAESIICSWRTFFCQNTLPTLLQRLLTSSIHALSIKGQGSMTTLSVLKVEHKIHCQTV